MRSSFIRSDCYVSPSLPPPEDVCMLYLHSFLILIARAQWRVVLLETCFDWGIKVSRGTLKPNSAEGIPFVFKDLLEMDNGWMTDG